MSDSNGGTGNEVNIWTADEEDGYGLWVHDGPPDAGKVHSAFAEVMTEDITTVSSLDRVG